MISLQLLGIIFFFTFLQVIKNDHDFQNCDPSECSLTLCCSSADLCTAYPL